MRTLAAFALAAAGTVAIYAGFLLNAAALGGTLGDVLTVPGIALVAASPLIVHRYPSSTSFRVIFAIARYMPLPLFVLGAWMLSLTLPGVLSGRVGQVHGIYWAAFVTVAGFLAITWPELLAIKRQFGRTNRT